MSRPRLEEEGSWKVLPPAAGTDMQRSWAEGKMEFEELRATGASPRNHFIFI